MKRKIRILLCSVIFGLSLTSCIVLPGISGTEKKQDDSKVELQEPVCTTAWWSTMYETPNPERLPVKVRFQWFKGLE